MTRDHWRLLDRKPADFQKGARSSSIRFCRSCGYGWNRIGKAMQVLTRSYDILAVYSEQLYWTDAGQFLQHFPGSPDTTDVGYGTQAPPAPPDNLVFSYLYVLPYFLKARGMIAE